MMNGNPSATVTKAALIAAVEAAKAETKAALETFLAALNHGQRKKIVKDEKVKPLLDRYGVEYEVE